MANDSSNVTVVNGHLDSLISYVLDVKPYHTKLSEIVEEYVFSDSFSVHVDDSNFKSMTVVGLDYLKKSSDPVRAVWEYVSPRGDGTLSADKTFFAGSRTAYGVPRVHTRKLFSESSKERHTISIATPTTIPGLNGIAIDNTKYDGPGIPYVSSNDDPLAESIGFHVSNGVFSFNTYSGEWRPFDTDATLRDENGAPILDQNGDFIDGLGLDFINQPGNVYYADVNRSYGSIIDITSSGTPEEWTLTWVEADENLTVVGSTSGLIGTAELAVPFIHAQINFTFAHGDSVDISTVPIFDGDQFVLTPKNKLTLNAASPNQTWSIIKVNPIALDSAPVFTGDEGILPSLSVYTRSLTETPATTFTVTFTGPWTYTVSSSEPLDGYPKTGNTAVSFKDNYVHFTIRDNGRAMDVGDEFEFATLAPENQAHYLVFGSVSGWMTPAKIDTWYYNGHIGFKIPRLQYYACMDGDTTQEASLFTPNNSIHPCATSSKYEVIFREAPPGQSTLSATVENNLYGFREGLTIGAPWTDEFCAFTIDGGRIPGERMTVYLVYDYVYSKFGGYDEFSYETLNYDVGGQDFSMPDYLMQEYFPFSHSYGTVIIPAAADEDEIVIDKVEFEHVRLRVGNLEDALANVDSDGWVPLHFKYETEFPDTDAVEKITAYLASYPEVKVFEIRQNGLSVLEFDSTWFGEYAAGNTEITLRFHQQSSWAQTINVKVTEHVRLAGSIDLELEEDPGVLNTFTDFTESLTFKLYVDAVLDTIAFTFDTDNPNEQICFTEELAEYKVMFTHPVSITKLLITPDVGSPFSVDITPATMDPGFADVGGLLFEDTFTGAAGSILSHTTDSGHSWNATSLLPHWTSVGETAALDGSGNFVGDDYGIIESSYILPLEYELRCKATLRSPYSGSQYVALYLNCNSGWPQIYIDVFEDSGNFELGAAIYAAGTVSPFTSALDFDNATVPYTYDTEFEIKVVVTDTLTTVYFNDVSVMTLTYSSGTMVAGPIGLQASEGPSEAIINSIEVGEEGAVPAPAEDPLSYTFEVPPGTVPFCVTMYQAGLGFDLGGSLGGVE